MFVLSLALAAVAFLPPVRYSASADQALLVRDLDGDGAADILTSGNQVDESSSFSLLRNRGDGSFETERLIAAAFGERIEDAGDLDGDGVPDLVASNYWSNGIAIHLGTRPGVPYATATHGGPSLIADYDGDGIADIVSFSFGSGNPVRVHLFHGNGDGTFAARTTTDTAIANAAEPSMRVMNGALEILAGERSAHLVLFRIVNGAVAASRIGAGPAFDLSSTFADVDGDGIADIIDASDDGAVFLTIAKSDGSFGSRSEVGHLPALAFPTEVRAVDVDGDGRRDLIVEDFEQPVLYVFRNEGAGKFAEAVAVDAGGPVNAFETADVNRDGCADIVTANEDRSVSVILNRGCRPARRRAVR